MKTKIILVIILLYSTFLFAQNTKDSEKPPLKSGKIALEALSATALGAGFAYIGGSIGAAFSSGDGFSDIAGALLGVGIGYPVGSALGAYLVGNTGNERSSFWAAFGGSAAGAALGIIFISSTARDSRFYIYLATVPIGAVIGHNLGRHFKSTPGSALLNYKSEHLYWSLPSPVITWNPHQKNKLQTRFQLVSLSF